MSMTKEEAKEILRQLSIEVMEHGNATVYGGTKQSAALIKMWEDEPEKEDPKETLRQMKIDLMGVPEDSPKAAAKRVLIKEYAVRECGEAIYGPTHMEYCKNEWCRCKS